MSFQLDARRRAATSAAVPDEPGHFLINPFGLAFDEVTASNLVKINDAAEIIEGVLEWPALLRKLDRIAPDFRN